MRILQLRSQSQRPGGGSRVLGRCGTARGEQLGHIQMEIAAGGR